MAKNKNSNKGMVLGTVVGAVAGAAYAMWKTPMSGKELRGKLSTGPVSSPSSSQSFADSQPTTTSSGGVTDKVMGAVERTLAPIVGVNLGKTANGSGQNGTSVTEPITPAYASTDIASPAQMDNVTSATGEPIADPSRGESVMSTGSDTIRMKKFAWGTPQPDADQAEVPIQAEENAPVEPVTDATTVPAAAAVTTTATTTTTNEAGLKDSINSKRFAWGDPKPETADAAVEAPIVGNDPAPVKQSTDSVGAAPAVSESAGTSNVDSSVVASAASVSTGKMVPFPKLGGLEK